MDPAEPSDDASPDVFVPLDEWTRRECLLRPLCQLPGLQKTTNLFADAVASGVSRISVGPMPRDEVFRAFTRIDDWSASPLFVLKSDRRVAA